jgi:hypothetical protein
LHNKINLGKTHANRVKREELDECNLRQNNHNDGESGDFSLRKMRHHGFSPFLRAAITPKDKSTAASVKPAATME